MLEDRESVSASKRREEEAELDRWGSYAVLVNY